MNRCEQLRQEYEAIQSLKAEFDLAHQEAIKTENLEKARELKSRIESRISSLREKLWPFEALTKKELQEQYESQRAIFERSGILEKLSTGEMGIKAIDSREYTFPTMEEIFKMMKENKEILKPKTEQGFQKLFIVPFGMKLDDLIEKYKQVILKHHREGKLFATKKEPTDPDEPLQLNEADPIYVWDKYPNADVSGELVYDPENLPTTNEEPDAEKRKQLSKGKTKSEKIIQQGVWDILLVQDLPNIPRENQGKIIGGRPQIDTAGTSIKRYIKRGETIPSPAEYHQAIQNEPIYQNEIGMTPEDQVIYALVHLEQTNQVIDDYQGNGSV
ncbi:MAG: Uncharacterized protein CEN89_676, partial [Candidatus Berkelbacteria bacterium Licking1014_7]